MENTSAEKHAAENGPKLSVIVPFYNNEAYLSTCVDSLLAQTEKDMEILLIDDGSTDASAGISDRYAALDSRVRAVHIQHSGVSEARNTGLKIARGRYIGFCDGDDRCAKNMFGELLSYAGRYAADVVRANFWIETQNAETSNKVRNGTVSCVNWRQAVVDSIRIDGAGYGGTVWNNLFSAKVIREPFVQYFDETMIWGEDQDWLRRVLTRSNKVVLIPDCYYYYNKINPNSATNTGKTALILESGEKTLAFLRENGFDPGTIAAYTEKHSALTAQNEMEKYLAGEKIRVSNLNGLKYSILKGPCTIGGRIKMTAVWIMILLRLPPKWVKTVHAL